MLDRQGRRSEQLGMASFQANSRFTVAVLTAFSWFLFAALGCSEGAGTPSGSGGTTGAAGQPASSGGQMASGGQTATGGRIMTGGSSASGGVAPVNDADAGAGGRDASVATGGQATGGADAGAAGQTASGGQTATGGRSSTGASSATGGAAPGNDAAAGTAGRDASVAAGGQATGGADAGGADGGRADAGSGGSGGGSDSGESAGGADGGVAYNPCPLPGPCAIMPLGDSITLGTGSSDGGGYRVELFKQAVANSQSITFVGTLTSGPTTVSGKAFPRSHEGHSGFVIDTITQRQGLSSVTDAAIANSIPHIVLLMIGTNDIVWKVPDEPTRLGNLIDKILADAPKALVVVAQIGPSNDDARTALIKAYNDGIPAVVQARVAAGKHVAMVDMFTPFVSDVNYKTALLSDEVHPNDAGYVIVGQTWYQAIQSFLPRAH